jgi:hypothetical protein
MAGLAGRSITLLDCSFRVGNSAGTFSVYGSNPGKTAHFSAFRNVSGTIDPKPKMD